MNTPSHDRVIEQDKILFRKLVAPNLIRWYAAGLVAPSTSVNSLLDLTYPQGSQIINCCSPKKLTIGTSQCLLYRYDITSVSQTKRKFLALILSHEKSNYSERHEIRKAIQKTLPDAELYSISAETLSSIANDHSKWSMDQMYVVLNSIFDIEEYKQLRANFDLDKALAKVKEQRLKQKQYFHKKKVVKFTFSSQKKIAFQLLHALTKKTDNYFLKLLIDELPADQADTSGRALVEAITALGLDQHGAVDLLAASTNPHARRFAALFGAEGVAPLLDKDQDVRLAAQLRRKEKA
jgi:hypothetical protein